MKTNKLFLLLIITSLSYCLQAQIFSRKTSQFNLEQKDAQPWGMGFYLGYNFLQYSIQTKPQITGINSPTVTTKSNGGFNIGLMLRRRIFDNMDVRFEPGAILVDRTITFTNLDPAINANKIRKKPSTFVYIPLIIDFHGNRYKNTRPYIAGGISYLYNLQSDEKSTNDNQNGTFRTKANNFAAEAELGINIYFEKFKLTPAIKGTFFLNNELVADNLATLQQAETIKDIRTNGIMLSLKFE